MLPSANINDESSACPVTAIKPVNADPKDRILQYIDSCDRSVLEERSEIMDAIEFSKGYPTKDRMKLGVCCLEVGLNLLSEELGVAIFDEDYRKEVNDALKTVLQSLCTK